WNGIPNASPDTAVSSVFMNKEFSQIAARGLGIPVARSFAVSEREWLEDGEAVVQKVKQLGFPVIVKPSRLGSSIGIKVAKNDEELAAALTLAFRLDDGVLLEEYFLHKRDINCAAYKKGGEIIVSLCEEVFSDQEILTFSEKYEGTGMRGGQLPADLPEEISEQIQEYTKLLYESFHVRGVVRADFLIADGNVYFNELNTVPGSLACYLFGESLTHTKNFLVSLVEEALSARAVEKEIVCTGILNDSVFGGGKGRKRLRAR
ncbi:MAG: ATP-grasp domain-containing protein, partial [Clostridiales bacterium]|nr:ATP-grasp domain-containing protein [Clostridiales bacterium]